MTPIPTATYDPDSADELRTARALDAMLGLEGVLDELPPAALLPVGYVRSLVGLVNDAVRDLLLYEPNAPAANDNR